MAKKVFADQFSEPLNGMKTARIDIHAGDGNLTIDWLTPGEQVLASGTLQYLENQGRPMKDLISRNGQATLTLKGSRIVKPWFHLPWSTCNGATDWHIHLNPNVSSDITAHSDGGNIRLDLAGMTITRVMADTGGGNIDVILPNNAIDLKVTTMTGAGNINIEIGNNITGNNVVEVKSGAGNVIVRVPIGIAARIQPTTGLGKTIVDPQFSRLDNDTYQSPDFDNATHKLELTLKSGAGNVIIEII